MRHQVLFGATLLLMTACADADTSDERGSAPGPARGDSVAENERSAGTTGEHDLHDEEGLPLLVVMQRMTVDMAGFAQGLWLEDYTEMTARADAIANHPHMSASEVQRIQAELGDEMVAFEEADETVHQAALRMHEAAGARDLDAILEALSEVQEGCVACHTRFRDRLRTVQP
jgi:cytochrome c556